MSLPKLLRTARQERGLLQDEIARHVGVAQSTVCSWENGTQLPSTQYWLPLAFVLALGKSEVAVKAQSAETVREALKALDSERAGRVHLLATRIEREAAVASARPRKSRILSAEEYLKQQQAHLEAVGGDLNNISICFLGPQNLPVLDYPEVEDVWVRNLERGVDYIVIWFLCLVNTGVIWNHAQRFRSIGERVQSNGRGMLRHLGLRLLTRDPDPVYEENRRDFQMLADASFPGNSWEFKEVDEGLKRMLLQHHIPHGSLVVYYHRIPGGRRFAGVSLRATRTAPDAKEQPAFHFLGKLQTDELYTLIGQLVQTTEKLHPTKRRAP